MRIVKGVDVERRTKRLENVEGNDNVHRADDECDSLVRKPFPSSSKFPPLYPSHILPNLLVASFIPLSSSSSSSLSLSRKTSTPSFCLSHSLQKFFPSVSFLEHETKNLRFFSRIFPPPNRSIYRCCRSKKVLALIDCFEI